jgi:hypothetical protein
MEEAHLNILANLLVFSPIMNSKSSRKMYHIKSNGIEV